MIPSKDILLKAAIRAVLSAARVVEESRENRAVQHKGSLRDIVTQADLDSSRLLQEHLRPTGIVVISEENTDGADGQSPTFTPDTFWAVDPIDGTANFAHGLHQFAICAGLVEQGDFQLGVVCAPALDEFYCTTIGHEVLLNGRTFTHTHRQPTESLLAASLPAAAPRACYDLFQKANETTRGCLRTGSAALNICWTASGKLQGAFGFGARVWDVAGALAIARAAGCEILVRHRKDLLTLDYCAGSQDVVRHIMHLANQHGVWNE